MLAAAQFMLGNQHVHTALIAFAVIGADTTDRIDWIELTAHTLTLLTLLPHFFSLPVTHFQVYREELLIMLIVFDFSVYDGLVIAELLDS